MAVVKRSKIESAKADELARSHGRQRALPTLVPGSSHQNTGTLGKALEVLNVIAKSAEPPRFTDILNELNQPRGTLHRHLTNLIEEGLVDVSHDGSYTLGLRLLTLAAGSWSQNSLRSVAEPHIRKLHEAVSETVHLGALSGLEVVYLDKLESKQSVRMHSQVGNASPLYCTGIGKAILSVLPPEEFAEKAARFEYIQHTPTTLHTAALLTAEIEQIRGNRIAHDREEHEPGICCVAAGIGGVETGVYAGLSVTAPSFRVTRERMSEWELLVSEIAENIERDLGPGLGPRHAE